MTDKKVVIRLKRRDKMTSEQPLVKLDDRSIAPSDEQVINRIIGWSIVGGIVLTLLGIAVVAML